MNIAQAEQVLQYARTRGAAHAAVLRHSNIAALVASIDQWPAAHSRRRCRRRRDRQQKTAGRTLMAQKNARHGAGKRAHNAHDAVRVGIAGVTTRRAGGTRFITLPRRAFAAGL